MAIDEYESALRKLLDEAVRCGLNVGLLITVTETELEKAIQKDTRLRRGG